MAYSLPEDLLECSVCLEALDEQSKALPCQHTFCENCLKGVVSCKGYLQCPECRTDYPHRTIDDLPPNILLMRILGGIKKSAPKNLKVDHVKEFSRSSQKAECDRLKKCFEGIIYHVPHAKAIYNFDGIEEVDLRFKKGDIIYLYQQFDENWYEGSLHGIRGDVPASFIKVIVPIPDFDTEKEYPLARAICNLGVKREDFIISFRKGDVISVIKKIDANWGEGLLGDQHGIFPLSFVELNEASKDKVAADKSSDEEEISDSTETLPTPNTPEHNDNISPWVKLEPPKRHSIHVDKPGDENKSPRRLLEVSSESTDEDPTRSESPRHLARRASGPALMPEPCNHVPANLSATTGQSSSSDNINSTTSSNSNKPTNEDRQLRRTYSRSSKPRPRSEEELVSSRSRERHPDLFIARYNYAQQRSDELALLQGEHYIVTERYLDGWCRGFHVRSRQSGMFPGNYLRRAATMNCLHIKPEGSLHPQSPTALKPHFHRSPSSPTGSTTCFQFPSNGNTTRTRSVNQRQRSGSAPTDPQQVPASRPQGADGHERGGRTNEGFFLNWKKYFKRQPLEPPPYPTASQNQCSIGARRSARPPPIPVGPPPPYSPPYSPPGTSVPLSVPITIPRLTTAVNGAGGPEHSQERYRVVASFPPQSKHELELKVGDILIVVKKRSDGWFQGKSQRTGKIGLFPASFVERF